MSYKVEAWPWCADYCKKNKHSPYDSYFWDKALLEYRRANNIFEVGDKVFCEHFEMDSNKDVLTVEIVRGHYLQLSQGIGCVASLVRHATDAEIAAGHRL